MDKYQNTRGDLDFSSTSQGPKPQGKSAWTGLWDNEVTIQVTYSSRRVMRLYVSVYVLFWCFLLLSFFFFFFLFVGWEINGRYLKKFIALDRMTGISQNGGAGEGTGLQLQLWVRKKELFACSKYLKSKSNSSIGLFFCHGTETLSLDRSPWSTVWPERWAANTTVDQPLLDGADFTAAPYCSLVQCTNIF